MSPTEITTPQIPLDPTKWLEPKETFIGRIKVCHYATTDDAKDKDGRTFTEVRGYPRPGQTWEVQVERLDAVYVNKVTGEEAPERPRRFATIDLERYDERKRQMVPVMQGNNKANFVIGKWLEAKVPLHPDPTRNEGMVCEFEFLRSKNFGGNTAKNLLYPIKVLALPNTPFEFRGEVQRFEFDPNKGVDMDAIAADIEATAPAGAGTSQGDMLTDEAIMGLFVGLSAEDEEALMKLVAGHKSELAASTKTALLGGDFTAKAVEAGKLVIDKDGTFQRP